MKEYYRHKVLVSAHRGNSKYFPESTLPAFESALTLDIDMIELDVHMTKDGEIVIMHDAKVDRTTNGSGAICDLTLAEIKMLDAGSWKEERFSGTKVPLLAELFELIKERKDIMLNIELKDYPDILGEKAFISCDKAVALVEEYGLADRIVFNCFRGRVLEYIDKKYDHKYNLLGFFPVSFMGEGMTRDPFEWLYSMCFSDARTVAPKEDFDYIISRGIEPWIYYVEEDFELYKKAIERGVVVITANDPKRAIEIAEELKAR